MRTTTKLLAAASVCVALSSPALAANRCQRHPRPYVTEIFENGRPVARQYLQPRESYWLQVTKGPAWHQYLWDPQTRTLKEQRGFEVVVIGKFTDAYNDAMSLLASLQGSWTGLPDCK